MDSRGGSNHISGIRIIDTYGNMIIEKCCVASNVRGSAWYDISLESNEYLAGFYGNIHWSGSIVGFGAITVNNHSLLEI